MLRLELKPLLKSIARRGVVRKKCLQAFMQNELRNLETV